MLIITKKQLVKNRLLRLGSITGREAFLDFGLYRLSSVINRLRNEGIPIKTEMVKNASGVTYAKYTFDALHR